MAVLTAVLAAYFVHRLMVGGLELDQLHPAYLLPTVAITFIGGQTLATVGLHELGFASFGVYAAPPAVGGNAYFALTGQPDAFQHAWLGTFILFLLVQVALIPTVAKLPFSLTFWTMTFTTAAAGTYGIHWLAATQPAWRDVWIIAILAVVSLWIGWVAVRSILVVVANRRI